MVGSAMYNDEEIKWVLWQIVDGVKFSDIEKNFKIRFDRKIGPNQVRYLKNKYGRDPRFNSILINRPVGSGPSPPAKSSPQAEVSASTSQAAARNSKEPTSSSKTVPRTTSQQRAGKKRQRREETRQSDEDSENGDQKHSPKRRRDEGLSTSVSPRKQKMGKGPESRTEDVLVDSGIGAWHTTADSHGSSNKSFAGQHSSLPQASSPIPGARSAYLGTKGPGVGQSVGIEAHSGATATKNCEGNKKIGNRGSHTSTAGDDLRKCGYMETGLDSYIGSRPDYSIPLADCNGPVEGAARVIGSINPRVGGSASKSKRFLTSDNASRPGYSETSHHTADLHAYKLPSTPKSHLSGTPNYDIFSGSLGLEDDTANYDWFLTQKRETDVAKDDFTIDLLGFDGGAVGTSLPNLNKALGPAMASGHRNPLKSDKVSSWEETAIGGNEAAKLSRPHIAARQRQAVCPLDLIKQPLQSWKVSPHAVHSNIPLQGEASSSAAPPTPAKQREEVQAPAQSPEGFESFPSPPYQERLKQVPGDLESLQSSRNIPRPAQKQQIDSQRLPAPQSLQTSSEAITSNENDKRPYLEGLLLGEENLSVSPPTSSNERRFYEMLMGLDQNPSLGTAHDDTNEFLGFEGIPSVMNEANYSIPPEGAAYDFMDGQPWQSPNQNGRRQAASIVSDRGSENLMLPTGLATLQYDHIDIGLLQQREYFPDPYLGFDATHYEIGRRHSQNLEHADPLDMHPVGDRMARGTATLFQPSQRDQTPMHQGHLAHEMPAFIGHTAQSPNPPMSAASVATLAAGATEDLFHEIYSPYSSAMSPWQQALPPTGFGG